jgi:uncharacterized protein with HEPN domain
MVDVEVTVADILAEIDAIEAAVAGRSLEEFRREWLFRRAVERGIEIISEACRRIPAHLQETRPEIPWKKVTGIGNLLRHNTSAPMMKWSGAW